MRAAVASALFLLSCLLPLRANAQATFERVWIDVDIGSAAAIDDGFAMQATRRLFAEDATFRAGYDVPRGFSFGVGGGAMLTRLLGVGLNITAAQHEDVAQLRVEIPHPFYGTFYASDDAETDVKLQRAERAVHIHAMVVPLQTDLVRVRVFGGPSWIRVGQDAVTLIDYRQVSSIVPPSNEVDIVRFTQDRDNASGWGYHAGADVSVFLLRNLGVGGFARFSRAAVDLPNTLTTGLDDPAFIEIRAGGVQVGAGVRLKF